MGGCDDQPPIFIGRIIMDDQDLATLARLVKEYPIEELIDALHQTIAAEADELVDLNLGDKAKELSKVAWHIGMLYNKLL